ncbi:MAG TPA: NADPH-dependent FMN reductase [Devosia sp.]
MSKPKIGIIISTTRQSRLGHRPAEWILHLAGARGDADYEIVDLRDYPMALFDAPMSPRFAPPEGEAAMRWAAKIAELDGYIFVTAEYNRSISAALKNALDHVYHEPARKPAAFVGYGAVGGARAVEHLRLMAIELSMAPIKAAVHVGMEPFLGMLQQGKDFADYEHLGQSAATMLDELAWWTKVLRSGRSVADMLENAA